MSHKSNRHKSHRWVTVNVTWTLFHLRLMRHDQWLIYGQSHGSWHMKRDGKIMTCARDMNHDSSTAHVTWTRLRLMQHGHMHRRWVIRSNIEMMWIRLHVYFYRNRKSLDYMSISTEIESRWCGPVLDGVSLIYGACDMAYDSSTAHATNPWFIYGRSGLVHLNLIYSSTIYIYIYIGIYIYKSTSSTRKIRTGPH